MPLELNPDIFRAVLQSLPIGVYLTDLKRQIGFWNTSAERITGYLGQEVIGHFCHDNLLMHCDENHVALCGCACPLAQTMQDGRPREARIFRRHREGHGVRCACRRFRLETSLVSSSAPRNASRSVRSGPPRWAAPTSGGTFPWMT